MVSKQTRSWLPRPRHRTGTAGRTGCDPQAPKAVDLPHTQPNKRGGCGGGQAVHFKPSPGTRRLRRRVPPVSAGEGSGARHRGASASSAHTPFFGAAAPAGARPWVVAHPRGSSSPPSPSFPLQGRQRAILRSHPGWNAGGGRHVLLELGSRRRSPRPGQPPLLGPRGLSPGPQSSFQPHWGACTYAPLRCHQSPEHSGLAGASGVRQAPAVGSHRPLFGADPAHDARSACSGNGLPGPTGAHSMARCGRRGPRRFSRTRTFGRAPWAAPGSRRPEHGSAQSAERQPSIGVEGHGPGHTPPRSVPALASAPAEAAARPSGLPSGPQPSDFRRAGGRAPPNDLLRRRSAGGGERMEASAPGRRRRRGWRRAPVAGSPLFRAAVVLLLSAFVARASPSGEASAALPPRLGAPLPPGPQRHLSVVVIKCGDGWGGRGRCFPPPFASSLVSKKFHRVCRYARTCAGGRAQPPPGNRDGVGCTIVCSDVRLCENKGSPGVA